MSIFEAKEWWSTSISNNEEFDGNSICIDNIDNENPPRNKICVSSFSGYLRIFEPSFGGYKVQNFLFEKCYENPILQISSGNFIINSSDRQLAILQCKSFFVLGLFNLRGTGTTKTYYEYKLVRNGYNFCLGRIGEKNYDIVFIQSIDGVISIYEQDSHINSVSLTEVLFPGPLSFLSKKDYIVLANTAYEVECYSYNNLATIKESDERKITPTWLVNVGEMIKEICILDNSITNKQEILVLSETMLSLLDSNGKFLYQKKLDFEPMSLFAYNVEDPNFIQGKGPNCMYMVSTCNDHILIYRGTSLAWAVKIFDTAVFLSTCEFEGVKGLIVTLSDQGKLSVIYLGMEQARGHNIFLPTKQVDLNLLATETEILQNVVNNYENGVNVIPEENLQLNLTVDPILHYDEDFHDDKFFHKENSRIVRARVVLSIHGNAENLRINIVTPYNIICDEPSFSESKLSGNLTKSINFRVYAHLFPTFSSIKLYATYSTRNSKNVTEKQYQSTSLEFDLPLSLFVRTCPINKEAKHKLTLCTDKDPINIPKIFADLCDNFADSNIINSSPNMIGFIYPNRAEVTVIISKNAGRYRIQSTQYEALLFITHQIITRINEQHQFSCDFYIEDELNLEAFFFNVINYFKLNYLKKEKEIDLEKYTSLYTQVQKSLLNKYKEKNPPNLNYLDFLLKNIYRSVNKQTEEMIKINSEFKFNIRNLIIWTESILYFLKLRAKLSDEHYNILKDSFPLDSPFGNEYSWEDQTLTNMTNLFKFYFSGDKSNLYEVKESKDFEKWKKYFKTLHDRLINNRGLI